MEEMEKCPNGGITISSLIFHSMHYQSEVHMYVSAAQCIIYEGSASNILGRE